MGAWEIYEARLGVSGSTLRDATLHKTQDYIQRKFGTSLSYQPITVGAENRRVAILDQNALNEKKICSYPGESLPHGSVIFWNDEPWLITEIDAHDEVYTSGKMKRCNHQLKWLDEEGSVITKWCIVEDGTKYLIGEKSSEMMTIGDARIAITIGKDADTNKLFRGRRFLVDDEDAGETVLAYQITKLNKLYNVYQGRGVFRFILNEVELTDDDNISLRIADFYNWAPPSEKTRSDVRTDATPEEIVSSAVSREDTTEDAVEEAGRWI